MGHYTTKEACYFPFLNLYFVLKKTLFGLNYCKKKVQILPVRHLGFCQNQENFTLFGGFEGCFNETHHVYAFGRYLRTFLNVVGGCQDKFQVKLFTGAKARLQFQGRRSDLPCQHPVFSKMSPSPGKIYLSQSIGRFSSQFIKKQVRFSKNKNRKMCRMSNTNLCVELCKRSCIDVIDFDYSCVLIKRQGQQ